MKNALSSVVRIHNIPSTNYYVLFEHTIIHQDLLQIR